MTVLILDKSVSLKKEGMAAGISGRHARSISDFWHKINKNSGTAYLVDRCKRITNLVKDRIVGQKYLNASERRRILKLVNPIEKPIIQLALRGVRGTSRALQFLNWVNKLKTPEVTQNHWNEFRKIIQSFHSEPLFLIPMCETDRRLFLKLGLKTPSFSRCFLTSKGVEYVGNNHVKEVTSLEDKFRCYEDCPRLVQRFSTFITDVLTEGDNQFIFSQRLLTLYASESEPDKNDIVGQINGLIKDGALKVRFIANLAKIHQFFISAAANHLKDFLRHQPMSAIFSQSDAVDWMHRKIKEGCNITSVDLTTATDLLPYKLFRTAIADIISSFPYLLRESYEYDHYLCLSDYFLGDSRQTVRYNIGQAMGRYTSKYQLDFTMLLLAKSVGGNENNCRINGDDIFFTDDRVGSSFISLLNILDVPISTKKTFVSRNFGEFSGRTVTEYGALEVTKAKGNSFMKDPLGPVRKYGKRGLRLVPRKYRNLVKSFSLLPDYGVPSMRRAYPQESQLYDLVLFAGFIKPVQKSLSKPDQFWVTNRFGHRILEHYQVLIMKAMQLSRHFDQDSSIYDEIIRYGDYNPDESPVALRKLWQNLCVTLEEYTFEEIVRKEVLSEWYTTEKTVVYLLHRYKSILSEKYTEMYMDHLSVIRDFSLSRLINEKLLYAKPVRPEVDCFILHLEAMRKSEVGLPLSKAHTLVSRLLLDPPVFGVEDKKDKEIYKQDTKTFSFMQRLVLWYNRYMENWF